VVVGGLGSLDLGVEVGVTNLKVGLGSVKGGSSAGLVEVGPGGIPLLLNDRSLVVVLGGLSLGATTVEGNLGLLVGELRAELPNLGLNKSVSDNGASGSELTTVGCVAEGRLVNSESGGGAIKGLVSLGGLDVVVDTVLGVLPWADNGPGLSGLHTVATVATVAAVASIKTLSAATDATLVGDVLEASVAVAI